MTSLVLPRPLHIWSCILIHVSEIFFINVYRLNCCENETVMYILIHVSEIFFINVYRLNCCENETVIFSFKCFISLCLHIMLS